MIWEPPGNRQFEFDFQGSFDRLRVQTVRLTSPRELPRAIGRGLVRFADLSIERMTALLERRICRENPPSHSTALPWSSEEARARARVFSLMRATNANNAIWTKSSIVCPRRSMERFGWMGSESVAGCERDLEPTASCERFVEPAFMLESNAPSSTKLYQFA